MPEFVANISVRIDAENYDEFIDMLRNGDWEGYEINAVTELN